jgi:hypothetical protein
MATITWNAYTGAWTDIGARTLVFSGSGDLTTPLTVNQYQDETHLGSGSPGTDQCGGTHMNNVQYVTDSSMKVNGGIVETINDTNLLEDECTLRVDFTDVSSVAVTQPRLYCYDGVTTLNAGIGVRLQGFEQGQGNTSWVLVNDYDIGYGGDNAGKRLDLSNRASSTSHSFFIALSLMPLSFGNKSQVDLGIKLTYS